jgi:hypothetical protein
MQPPLAPELYDISVKHDRCLCAHDRARRSPGSEFHLSHEFLAMMLGSTRPTVTIVAGTLQKAGLIKYIAVLRRENRRPSHNQFQYHSYPDIAGPEVRQ